MRERFNDAAKAACYLGLGLSSDYPNKNLEITYRSSGVVRQQLCSSGTAERVIAVMCRRFHESEVVYEPSKADGVVARIECHCVRGIKGTCCSHGSDRPHVTVRLVNIHATEDQHSNDETKTPYTLVI